MEMLPDIITKKRIEMATLAPYSLDRKSATAWEKSSGVSTNGKWVASGIMRIFPSGL